MDIIRLVKSCQSGERDALGLLYQTYLHQMHEVVAYYIHDTEAEWDILHDGFIIAFTSIVTLKNPAKVEAWLTSIMKNLALQYLKEKSSHTSVSLSEETVNYKADEESAQRTELTWEQIDQIIRRLPDGYGKVFRLATLEGLSHKEIAALLGIAPHSSSSQLTHAKAMLRRMITQYRMEIGVLSVIGIISLIWLGVVRRIEKNATPSVISKSTGKNTPIIIDSIRSANPSAASIVSASKTIERLKQRSEAQQNIAIVTIIDDTIRDIGNDSMTNDTVGAIPDIINREDPIAIDDFPKAEHSESQDWSLALAYSGSSGQNDMNRYMIPYPGIPSVEGPAREIEVTEKSHHHIPLVIGLSVNKSLTPRWSMETGLRYTFLRSDFYLESELMSRKTGQRIHYIGLPIKFNYRIFTYNGFSLYGQGGGALDIPVYGTQSVRQYTPESGTTNKETFHINAPLQWSVEGGLGIQYHFTPSFSIYAEPSFRYYFNTGSDIRTIRHDKPFEFTIPIGLRFSW